MYLMHSPVAALEKATLAVGTQTLRADLLHTIVGEQSRLLERYFLAKRLSDEHIQREGARCACGRHFQKDQTTARCLDRYNPSPDG